MGKKALVIGGSNGIGLAIVIELTKGYDQVNVVDKEINPILSAYSNVISRQVNLLNNDFDFLEDYRDIDTLIITAGFGRVARFEDIIEKEIDNSFQVNSIATIKILHFYFERLKYDDDFKCGVMGSIAGLVSSPLIALYGATKASICSIIESINIELEMFGSNNRITNISPGSIKGTKFAGGENDLDATKELAKSIIKKISDHETLYIPQYEEIYKGVIERYHVDAHQYGIDSYKYKENSGRIITKPQLRVGYLSGTFDLFHIGHLNLLRRAKQYCDYLVVGVHKDASHKGKEAFVPYEERVEILKNIKYVDKVIPSEKEDDEVFRKGIVKYNYLFVGSDYKGTERFNRYEKYFSDKDVEIVYFPYTKGTSSTQLRDALSAISKNTKK